jgi:hypothetical protein
VRNPCYSEHSSQRRHCPDPKGPGVEASESAVHDVQLTHPFQAPVHIFRNTTEGLCSVTVRYASSDEAVELRPAPGSRGATPSSSKEASSDIAIQDIKEGAKGGKKRPVMTVARVRKQAALTSCASLLW